MTEYRIEKADTREKYEGLRDLWVRVFGDEPGLVDHVYRTFGAILPAEKAEAGAHFGASDSENRVSGAHFGTSDNEDRAPEALFGASDSENRAPGAHFGISNSEDRVPGDSDIAGYVIRSGEGRVVSALTCYKCGNLVIPGAQATEFGAQTTGFGTQPAEFGTQSAEFGAQATEFSAQSAEFGAQADEQESGNNATRSAGQLSGRPIYVSYAICTDPEYRGLGLAGKLTEYVSRIVTEAGGISLVSPAEQSLIRFYSGLGYRESCFVREAAASPDYAIEDAGEDFNSEFEADADASSGQGFMSEFKSVAGASSGQGFGSEFKATLESALGLDLLDPEEDFEPVNPQFTINAIDVSTYNKYRESFLRAIPHAAMSKAMLDLVRSVSLNGDGLFLINDGDAICVISENGEYGALAQNGEHSVSAQNGESGGLTENDAGTADEVILPLIVNELLVNPDLRAFSEEIDEEIASRLAEHFAREIFGTEQAAAMQNKACKLVYRTPEYDTFEYNAPESAAPEYNAPESTVSEYNAPEPCICQSMTAGAEMTNFYFGFPVE